MSDSSATIVSKVPPSLRFGEAGWNYQLSHSELWRPSAHFYHV